MYHNKLAIMSGSFTGFSEEDIKKLNNKNPPSQRKSQATGM